MFVASCQQAPTVSPTSEWSEGAKRVGISLPSQSFWDMAGDKMKQMLELDGYEVDFQYARNDPSEEIEAQSNRQISQVRDMISGGCQVLVIAAVITMDEEWGNVLAAAKGKGIPVIAFEYLIMGTDAVSYFITFDFKERVGNLQGEYIAKALGLPDASGPFNIETFTDVTWYSGIQPPFWTGAMKVLQPYIDSGQINKPSDEWDYWPTISPPERMKDLLASKGYSGNGKKLDAVLASTDGHAQEVAQALLDAGYTPDDFPIITGADASIDAVKSIIAGTQSMTVFSDYFRMIDKTVEMVKAVANGETPEINDTTTYDNSYASEGHFIPTYLCDLIVVTKDNYWSVLVDSGFYTEGELS